MCRTLSECCMTAARHFPLTSLKATATLHILCKGSARQLNDRALRSCQASKGADSAQTLYVVCDPRRWLVPCGLYVDVLVHIFPPFDIQHTKSPKNPPRTHALDCMGEVSKLPGLANSHGNHIYNCLTTDTVRGVLLYSLGVSRLPKPDCSERSCYL